VYTSIAILIRSTALDTPDELLQIFYRFYQLDTDDSGLISNYQLLELDELKLSPFRPRLFHGLGLQTTGFDTRGGYKGRIRSKDELIDLGIMSIMFAREAYVKLYKKEIESFSGVAVRVDFKDPGLKDDAFTTKYIDFKGFVYYISVLSPKASLEAKAKCTKTLRRLRSDMILCSYVQDIRYRW
jgi:hypothetical protein